MRTNVTLVESKQHAAGKAFANSDDEAFSQVEIGLKYTCVSFLRRKD